MRGDLGGGEADLETKSRYQYQYSVRAVRIIIIYTHSTRSRVSIYSNYIHQRERTPSQLHLSSLQPTPFLRSIRHILVSLQPVQLVFRPDQRWVYSLRSEHMFLLLVVARPLHLRRDAQEQRRGESGQILQGVLSKAVEDL